jgi:hypothetical protein
MTLQQSNEGEPMSSLLNRQRISAVVERRPEWSQLLSLLGIPYLPALEKNCFLLKQIVGKLVSLCMIYDNIVFSRPLGRHFLFMAAWHHRTIHRS